MAKQHGLEWVPTTFGLEPRWTSEPDITKVQFLARKHLQLAQDARCEVSFFAQGAFNKLYKVETEDSCFLMRVTLPVDPLRKTSSEVATIRFVQANTDIPAPEIIAFDSSSENELGFEWMLMERLPGVALRSIWRKLSTNVKRNLVKEVMKYQSQLYEHKFSAIGNIFIREQAASSSNHQNATSSYPDDYGGNIQTQEADFSKESLRSAVPANTNLAQDGTQKDDSSSKRTSIVSELLNEEDQEQIEAPSPALDLGPIVSMAFFWGDHLTQDVSRGPFSSSTAWLQARLKLVLTDQDKILSYSDDEDVIEDAHEFRDIAHRLLKLLPSIFDSESQAAESYVLHHDDLSMQNILVDVNGAITGVVDWECVSTVPSWKACEFPHFLKDRERNEEPQREIYAADSNDDGDESMEASGGGSRPMKERLDNEGVNELYWEHLLEYELTTLRQFALEEMRLLSPNWIDEMEKGAVKADFEKAVQNCDNGWSTRKISLWLDAMEKGEHWDLRKSFLE